MPRSKVTSKYQVTIPKQVRDLTGVKAGEVVTVEAVSDGQIIVKRFRPVKEPLEILIGKARGGRAIPIKELEEKGETR